MSLRGATVLVATWQSRGSAIVKKILSLARLFLVSVPPTCCYILSICTNRYPDRPPLTVKGLYYKVEVNDKFANRQYLTISNYVIIKSITKISFVFAKGIFFTCNACNILKNMVILGCNPNGCDVKLRSTAK